MFFRSWFVAILLVAGCPETREVTSPTQVVVRIRNHDEALLHDMTALRIAVARQDGDEWTSRGTKSLPADAIRWPVDVPISPSTKSAISKPFEVVVEAVKGDAVLAQARAVTRFVTDEWRLLELWLYRCAAEEPVCAKPECHGSDCAACTLDGQCSPVGLTIASETYDPDSPPTYEPAPGSVQQDAGADAQQDDCGRDGSCPGSDPCAVDNGGCGSNAHCTVRDDAAECACKSGFEDIRGDGSECVDKCTLAGCDEHASCTIVAGEAWCRCEKGYLGTGTECTFDKSCADLNCHEHAHCVVEGEARRCECDDGYEGSGTACEDINECETASCVAGYPCVETEPPGYTCLGQFADWPMPDSRSGSKFPSSYDTSVDGIVTDNVTGLAWQREFPEIPECDEGWCAWDEANTYCEQLELAGYDDWRMPTRIELISIVDRTGLASVFPTVDHWSKLMIWSSTPVLAGVPGFAWTLTTSASQAGWVKCVRSGRLPPGTPEARYVVDTSENTVKDLRTGLTWQRELPATYPGCSENGCAPSRAVQYCASLGSGWRLPTQKELFTLYDHARGSPNVPSQGLVGEPSLDLAMFPIKRPEYGYLFVVIASFGDHAFTLIAFDQPQTPPFTGGGTENEALVRCVK